MAFENTAGLNVFNHYGPRGTGNSVGNEHSQDGTSNLTIQFTGDSLNEGFLSPFVALRGMHVLSYKLIVDEAFTLTGTTPVVNFGSAGTVATNGVTLTATELGTLGSRIPASTGNGTWSNTSNTGIAANAKVGFVLGGTTPAVTKGVGRGTLVVTYFYETKV